MLDKGRLTGFSVFFGTLMGLHLFSVAWNITPEDVFPFGVLLLVLIPIGMVFVRETGVSWQALFLAGVYVATLVLVEFIVPNNRFLFFSPYSGNRPIVALLLSGILCFAMKSNNVLLLRPCSLVALSLASIRLGPLSEHTAILAPPFLGLLAGSVSLLFVREMPTKPLYRILFMCAEPFWMIAVVWLVFLNWVPDDISSWKLLVEYAWPNLACPAAIVAFVHALAFVLAGRSGTRPQGA